MVLLGELVSEQDIYFVISIFQNLELERRMTSQKPKVTEVSKAQCPVHGQHKLLKMDLKLSGNKSKKVRLKKCHKLILMASRQKSWLSVDDTCS